MSIFSKLNFSIRRPIGLSLAACAMLTLFTPSGCSKKDEPAPATENKTREVVSTSKKGSSVWNRAQAETEYALIQAELKLAKKKEAYLVINLPEKELQIRLGGVVVWSFPMEIDAKDSDNMDKFVEHFIGDDGLLVRPLLDKHLYAYSDKSSDSVLKIVGSVVFADVALMQRQVPERFDLLWDNDLIMEVRSDVAGQPISKLKNTMVEIRKALERPFGEAHIVIRMNSERAITFNRALVPGFPTLIIPAR